MAMDSAHLGDWAVRFFPGKSTSAQIAEQQIQDLLQKAGEAQGAHIVGFHQTGDRGSIAQRIRAHFRFRWGDAETLWSVGTEATTFQTYLSTVLIEENSCREHIRPRGKSSPLIFPGNIFSRLPEHPDIWGECEMWGREENHFERLAKKIKRFANDHTKANQPKQPTYMVDRTGLVWKDAGPYHAKTPFPRRWKYSTELEDMFHYDVEHENGNAFNLTDSSGTIIAVKATKHVNIDCHGYRSH